MKVLCRRGRLGGLQAIQVTAQKLREEQVGKVRVQVTSAQPLSDQQRGSIADRLRQSLGKEPILLESVNPSLVGGVVLRIGDKVIDGSVQGKINTIERLVEKNVHEKIRERFDALTSS